MKELSQALGLIGGWIDMMHLHRIEFPLSAAEEIANVSVYQ